MFSIVCPEEFHRRFLTAGLREDGRAFDESRAMPIISSASMNSSFDYESFCARKGRSLVYLTVNPQVTTSTSSGSGYFGVKVSFCSSLENYSKDKNLRYSRLLYSLLYPLLNHQVLSIENGVDAVWAIYLEVLVLVDDGSIFDLIIEASRSILQKYFIPEVLVDKRDDGTILIKKTGSISSTSLIPPNINLTYDTILILSEKNDPTITPDKNRTEHIFLLDPNNSEESLPNKSEVFVASMNNENDGSSKKNLLFSKISGQAIPWSIALKAININCNKVV